LKAENFLFCDFYFVQNVTTELLTDSTCPNCWTDFPLEDVKWISAHEDLMGDCRLGPDANQRFRPTRFDVHGNAIDVKGLSCQDFCCPHCHLRIPRSVLVFGAFFLSIAGTPSCGKSFYLGALAWKMRQTLPKLFNLLVSDSDGESNKILNNYEDQLFFSSDKSGLVRLAKTDVTGDWYSIVQYADQAVTYPKPFYFNLRPSAEHFNVERSRKLSRLLCLYDNAGESFFPGADTVSNPVTRHLGIAQSWLFCFDPTQDPRFRRELKGKTNDHQVNDGPVTARQEVVLNEMINRIRKHSDLGLKDKSHKPLIVVCTKFDAWSGLIDKLPKAWVYNQKLGGHLLDLDKINFVSDQVKAVLMRLCPEVVSASKSISDLVYYIPVSATGDSPVKDPRTGEFRIRTDFIDPVWCEIPLLLALAHRAPQLVKVARRTVDPRSPQ
jgi:hypothetical protein